MKKMGKGAVIKNALLTDIRSGVLNPGDMLPSRLRCMERFSCSRTTIDRVIADLTAAGVLFSRHGAGTFVADRRESRAEVKRLYIINTADYARNYSFIPGSLETRLSQQIPCRLVGGSKFLTELENIARPGNAVLWMHPHYNTLNAMEFFRNAGIPQLLLGRDFEGYDFIMVNARKGLEDGLQFLTGQDQLPLGLIHSETDINRPYIAERQLHFFRLIVEKELHLPVRFICKASRDDRSAAADMKRAAFQLLSGDDPCRRIYMGYSRWYDHFIQAAAELGKQPGRDFKLLVFDRPTVKNLPAGVAAIRQDYVRMISEILDFLDRRGQSKCRLPVDPVLEIGDCQENR